VKRAEITLKRQENFALNADMIVIMSPRRRKDGFALNRASEFFGAIMSNY
jgi:hypothetical protein